MYLKKNQKGVNHFEMKRQKTDTFYLGSKHFLWYEKLIYKSLTYYSMDNVTYLNHLVCL